MYEESKITNENLTYNDDMTLFTIFTYMIGFTILIGAICLKTFNYLTYKTKKYKTPN